MLSSERAEESFCPQGEPTAALQGLLNVFVNFLCRRDPALSAAVQPAGFSPGSKHLAELARVQGIPRT